MALVSEEYYSNTYIGEPVATDAFARLEARAEDLILGLLSLSATEVEELSTDDQKAVYSAICAQLEYLNDYGVTVATYGREGGGFTVGKVSVQGSTTKAGAAGTMICPAVYVYLERTGLLNPAVPVVGMPPQTYWGWP